MEYSPEYEQGIIPEMNCGNEEAYRAVFYHYYEPLCHYALSFIPDRDRAEDIVQEVFLKLWSKRKSLKADGSLKAYLYRMTYNEFVTAFRKEKRYRKELDEFKAAALQPLFLESEESRQLKLDRLKQAIDSLPPRCREIFLLHKQDGLKHRDIAQKLGISAKTVESQVAKAMTLLRKAVSIKELSLLFLIRKPFIQG